MMTHIIAFFTILEEGFHQVNTLVIYLYHASIMKTTQTTSHNWLRNHMTIVKNIGISFHVKIQLAHLSAKDKFLEAVM